MSALGASLVAFREQTDAAGRFPEGEPTLRRILAHQALRRRRLTLAVALGLSMAGSAVAYVGSQHRALRNGSRGPKAPLIAAPSPGLSPAGGEELKPAAPSLSLSPAGASAPQSPSPLTGERAGVRGSSSLSPPASRAAPDSFRAEDELFAQAQRAHAASVGSDAELMAWDHYLASYPEGRFSPEARYRRGVTLAELQRWDAAREALTPFAQGVYGDYRQDEAAEWLRSLPDP